MEGKKNVQEKLLDVQSALKAPKSQYNNFGKYAYRNAEDIVEAVKPLAKANRLLLNLTDEVVAIGGRVYIKATAIVTDVDNPAQCVVCSAYAREPEAKKGMDESQITGAASSYARKYALNGLFAIDDTKDADSNNQGDNQPKQAQIYCADCGALISPTTTKTVEAIAKYGKEKFGRVLCANCMKKAGQQ